MRISVENQALTFLLAAATGVALGVLYDMMRVLRRRWKNPWLTAVLDLLFCAVCAGTLVLFVMTVSQGRWRGFIPLGAGMGIALYFLLASPFIVRMGDGILAAAVMGLRLAVSPLVIVKILLKKSVFWLKNIFKLSGIWCNILKYKDTSGHVRDFLAVGGNERNRIREKTAWLNSGDDRLAGAGGIRGSKPDKHADKDKRRKKSKQAAGASGGRASKTAGQTSGRDRRWSG